MRFEKVTVPTDGFDRINGDAQTGGQSLHHGPIMPSTASNNPALGRNWYLIQRCRNAFNGEGRQCRSAINCAERLDFAGQSMEIVAVKRLGRR